MERQIKCHRCRTRDAEFVLYRDEAAWCAREPREVVCGHCVPDGAEPAGAFAFIARVSRDHAPSEVRA